MDARKVRVVTQKRTPKSPPHVETLPVCQQVPGQSRAQVRVNLPARDTNGRLSDGSMPTHSWSPTKDPGLPPKPKSYQSDGQRSPTKEQRVKSRPLSDGACSPTKEIPSGSQFRAEGQRSPVKGSQSGNVKPPAGNSNGSKSPSSTSPNHGLPPKPSHKPRRQPEIHKQASLQYAEQVSRPGDDAIPSSPPATIQTHEPVRIQSILHRRVSLNENSPRSDAAQEKEDRNLVRLLEGHLDNIPPVTSKTVRVFLSSTFSDMVQERNALMECVYPRLKDICREQFGLEFQVVDLRWGVREEAQDDHQTIDLCLQEIENCRRCSIGPCFVAFIGQKYGYRPFPPKINFSEFSVLRDLLMRDGQDVTLLDNWYRVDRNMIPSMSILQPISSILKHYNDKTNNELRERDQAEWAIAFNNIQALLRRGAELGRKKGVLSEKEMEKYFVSVTELEIEKGMMEIHDPNRNCFCFYRHINQLEEKLAYKRSHKFVDITPCQTMIDFDAQNLLKLLRQRKIESCLTSQENFDNFLVDWEAPDSADPNDDTRYLAQFCKAFFDKMYKLIKQKQTEINDLQNNSNLVEILQHLSMCRLRSEIFRGREEVLGRVLDYVYHPAQEPLVVHGESGSGKTSVVAKAASLVHRWFKDENHCVIMRFLGTTVRSCSIRLVLGSVCWQIANLYGLDQSKIPQDYPKLVRHFHNVLKVATRDRPLVIMLDSLDQLSNSHRAHNLAWVPLELPPHVHLVLSTLPDMFGLLDNLKTMISAPENFVQILPLGTQLSLDLIREWLRGANRTLTTKQFDIVRDVLEKCTLPLFTKLIFEEVCRWKSYSLPAMTVIADSVKGVINTLFDRVERYHGKTFVTHALSYITASKNGLSDNELEDLLSLDDVVLDDVFQHWVPPIRRIPPLLWPRLLNELGSYIMKREANGIIVFYWYHRQFIKVAQERYLSNLAHSIFIHTTVAHYFLGTWGGGQQKAFRYTENHMELLGRDRAESLADRKVPPQPLVFCRDPTNPEKVVYNLRKLSELPYHLLHSRRSTEMKSQVLFNYEWLHAKLSSMGLQDILSDFRAFWEQGEREPDIRLVGSAMRVGGSYVNQNPDTLSFDLTGRLLPYYNDHHNIRYLIQQCDSVSLQHSVMLPLFQCFEAPKRMLLYVLEDHSQVVYDLLFSKVTSEVVSISKDNTIAFWDLNFGERTRAIDISFVQPGLNTKLYQSSDGMYLVVDSDAVNSPALIFDMKTGLLLHKVGTKTATSRRAFISGFMFCRQKDIIDIRMGRIVKTLDDFVETKRFVTCGMTPDQKYLLIGEDKQTKMFDFEMQVVLAQFPGNNMPSLFVFSPDSKKVFIGYTEDCVLRVCDINVDSPTFGHVLIMFNYKAAFPNMKFLEGALFHKELAEIALCEKNPNLVLLNVKRCYLILFNLMTQNAKLLDVKAINVSNNTFLFGICFSMDGRFIIAGSHENLHIWSTENCKLVTTLALHTHNRFPMAICHLNNLIATASNIHTAVKVWDLRKVQSAEPGLLVKYGNPVNMVACAPEKRLFFVKHYYGYHSTQGYKFHSSFGIDVWNLNTGTCKHFLPFANYGTLLHMQTSNDGSRMGLLLNSREESYLVITGGKHGKTPLTLYHPEAKSFAVSPHWDFAVTCTSQKEFPDVVLWSLMTGDKIRAFSCSNTPVFSLDSKYLLYSQGPDKVEVFSIKARECISSFECRASILQVVPTCHHVVMVTETASPNSLSDHSQVTLWYYNIPKVMTRIYGVAPGGIKDMSKDGLRAVDGYLQVFDLKTGHLICRFDPATPHMYDFVCITYDGRCVVWADDLSLKIGDVKTHRITGNISLHEKPTSLSLMDYGYIVVVGREDGHVVTLKIMNKGDEKLMRGCDTSTLDLRINRILEIPSCSDAVIATFDPLFARKPVKIKDSEMPKPNEELHHVMEQKAKVPHAIIKTCSYGDLQGIESKDLVNLRRGSSPGGTYIKEGQRSGGSTPSSGTPVSGSPVMLRKKKSDRHRSKSTQGDMDNSTNLSKKRSCSLQDLFHVNKNTSTPASKKGDEKKQKRKSPMMMKALHHTGNLFMALTDVGSSRSLPRRFKQEVKKDSPKSHGTEPRRKSCHGTAATTSRSRSYSNDSEWSHL